MCTCVQQLVKTQWERGFWRMRKTTLSSWLRRYVSLPAYILSLLAQWVCHLIPPVVCSRRSSSAGSKERNVKYPPRWKGTWMYTCWNLHLCTVCSLCNIMLIRAYLDIRWSSPMCRTSATNFYCSGRRAEQLWWSREPGEHTGDSYRALQLSRGNKRQL